MEKNGLEKKWKLDNNKMITKEKNDNETRDYCIARCADYSSKKILHEAKEMP